MPQLLILEAAAINIVMNLEYQIKYSDCSILFSNKTLRQLAHQHEKRLQKIPSIIDDLPKEQEVGWKEYKGMNLIAANAISMFISSFARETEWDMSNYRTWLTTKRPKFAIPWAIPVIAEESQWNKELLGGRSNTMDDVITRIGKREDALLFDIDENDIRNKGGKKDSCCVLVKIRGEFDIKERETIKRIIKDKFNIEESRMIFVKIPIIDGEQANVTILVNTKAIGPKILEKTAVRIKENRAKLAQLEESLAYVNTEIHEIPLKRNTESTFAKIIGIGYDDRIDELKKSKDNLENQIKNLSDAVTSDMSSFISEISSPDLVIPLEPNPNLKDDKIIYKYRDGAKFNNIFDVLSELLGLSAPLVVKDVMLSSTEITIATREEFEAKQKFISAMNEIQKTLLIKKSHKP